MGKGKEASEDEMMSWPLSCVGIGGPHGCCGLLHESRRPGKRRLGWSGCLLSVSGLFWEGRVASGHSSGLAALLAVGLVTDTLF